MTSIKEYISYGIDRTLLIKMMKTSVASKDKEWGEVLYIGIENKGHLENDGSDYGKWIPTPGKPVFLKRYRVTGAGVYFKRLEPDKIGAYHWNTGNGNATLSPWDCEKLLREVEEVKHIDLVYRADGQKGAKDGGAIREAYKATCKKVTYDVLGINATIEGLCAEGKAFAASCPDDCVVEIIGGDPAVYQAEVKELI